MAALIPHKTVGWSFSISKIEYANRQLQQYNPSTEVAKMPGATSIGPIWRHSEIPRKPPKPNTLIPPMKLINFICKF